MILCAPWDIQLKDTSFRRWKTTNFKSKGVRISHLFLTSSVLMKMCSSLELSQAKWWSVLFRSRKTRISPTTFSQTKMLPGATKRLASWVTFQIKESFRKLKTMSTRIWCSDQHQDRCMQTTSLQQNPRFKWFIRLLLTDKQLIMINTLGRCLVFQHRHSTSDCS